MENNYTYLKLLQSKDISFWDVIRLSFSQERLSNKFPLVKLESVISPRKEKIKKAEYKGKEPIVSKISFNDGKLHLRDDRTTGMDLYKLYKDDLLVSNINFHQGAVAINNLETLVCSTHYQPYIVDYSKIDPMYLILVLRNKVFLDYILNQKTNGIKTEAHYNFIKELEIPLPDLEKQKELVSNYEYLQNLAIQKEENAKKIENSIDDYLLSELGINNIDEQSKENKLFSIVTYKQLQNAWQLQVEQIDNEKEIMLQDACIFVKRTWTKKDRPYFNYIEINSINKNQEIEHTNTIDTRKAPSRATQIVYKGDLIIATTRPYLKKFAIVSEKNNNDICSSGFQILNAKKEFNIEFVKLFLSSSVGISRLSQKMTGALYPAINTSDLKKIYIPNRPCIEQNKIVEHISEYKNKVKNLMQESNQLKQQAISNFEQEVFN